MPLFLNKYCTYSNVAMTENLAITAFSTKTFQLQFMVSSYPLVNSQLISYYSRRRESRFKGSSFNVHSAIKWKINGVISLEIQTEKLQIDHQKRSIITQSRTVPTSK